MNPHKLFVPNLVSRVIVCSSASLGLAIVPASAALTFVNAGLEEAGPISAQAPSGWSQVPFDAAFSEATAFFAATADILGPGGYNVAGGIFGAPKSGLTFASGLNFISGGQTYQEGIRQTVSGFTVGADYSFSFFQAVTMQQNALDDTGAWKVYANGVLVATTAPTVSLVEWNDPSKPGPGGWEQRTITFTAGAEAVELSFLPYDPDGVLTAGAEGLRMGIDSFSEIVAVPEPSVAGLAILAGLGLIRRKRR